MLMAVSQVLVFPSLSWKSGGLMRNPSVSSLPPLCPACFLDATCCVETAKQCAWVGSDTMNSRICALLGLLHAVGTALCGDTRGRGGRALSAPSQPRCNHRSAGIEDLGWYHKSVFVNLPKCHRIFSAVKMVKGLVASA